MTTVAKVAETLEVSPMTVRRWLAAGVIRGVRVTDRGNWKIPVSELERIQRSFTEGTPPADDAR